MEFDKVGPFLEHLPLFDGDSNQLESFLLKINTTAEYARWDEKDKNYALSAQLRGAAERYYFENLVPRGLKLFKEFSEALVERFGAHRGHVYYLRQFMSARQLPDESVVEFASRMEALSFKAVPQRLREIDGGEDYRCGMLAGVFPKGLKPHLRQFVLPRDPKTFEEAVKYAEVEERIFETELSRAQSYGLNPLAPAFIPPVTVKSKNLEERAESLWEDDNYDRRIQSSSPSLERPNYPTRRERQECYLIRDKDNGNRLREVRPFSSSCMQSKELERTQGVVRPSFTLGNVSVERKWGTELHTGDGDCAEKAGEGENFPNAMDVNYRESDKEENSADVSLDKTQRSSEEISEAKITIFAVDRPIVEITTTDSKHMNNNPLVSCVDKAIDNSECYNNELGETVSETNLSIEGGESGDRMENVGTPDSGSKQEELSVVKDSFNGEDGEKVESGEGSTEVNTAVKYLDVGGENFMGFNTFPTIKRKHEFLSESVEFSNEGVDKEIIAKSRVLKMDEIILHRKRKRLKLSAE